MKKQILMFSVSLCYLLFTSCTLESINDDLNTEQLTASNQKNLESTLRFVTYNIHGGEGPDGEGNLTSNLTAFKNMLGTEQILFFQEVQPNQVNTTKSIFSDFPYSFYTQIESDDYWDWSSFSYKKYESGQIILSKIPFFVTNEALIQVDPGGDHWERKAQRITLDFDGVRRHFFHYHNTYNWNLDDFASEKEGLEKFKDYVNDQIWVTDYTQSTSVVMLGDFNLFNAKVKEIIPTTSHKFNGRDHISSMVPFMASGVYTTVANNLSDHNAVWAEIGY